MGWLRKQTEDYSGYSVSLSAVSVKDSVLLNKPHGTRLLKDMSQKVMAFFAILMVLAATFAGSLTAAQSANADVGEMITEGFNKIFCSGSPTGYGVADKDIQSPNTGTGRTKGATPYEKYGMSGTEWSVWIGFNNEDDGVSDDDFKGKGSSRGIISAVGGNGEDAGLDVMVNNFKGKQAEYPGLFNTSYECTTFSARNFPTMLGNLMLNTAKSATWLSGYAYQTAAVASESIYHNLEKPVSSVVKALKDKLYFQYLTPMIMIAALWMAYTGLVKRKTTEFMGGFAWLVIAMVGSVAFMSNPMLLPKLMNTTVTSISQSGMSAITSSTLQGKESMCYVAKGSGEKGSDPTLRAIQCNLWYAFVYTPWVVGQFGESPTELTNVESKDSTNNGFKDRLKSDNSLVFVDGKLRISVLTKTNNKNPETDANKLRLVSTTFGSENREAPSAEQNWALYLLDHKVNWDNATEKDKRYKVREQIHVAANQLTAGDYNATYRGDNAENRIAMGGMALLASVGAGIMIIIISVSLIILDIGVIILTLISPIFFLAALHPGAGRRIAMGWVESLIKMALKRIALSIFLAVMIAIFSVMIQSTQDMEWAIAMILIVAIALGGLTYQKQVSEMFNGFSLGGQEMQQQDVMGSGIAKQMGRSAMRSTKNNTLGLISGGRLGGNSVLGNRARDKNQKREWDERMASNSGAGQAPAPKDADDAGNAPLSRKEQRNADREAAAQRLLEEQGILNNGAGEIPAGVIPEGRESEDQESLENNGAGEIPDDRQEYESTKEVPTGDLENTEEIDIKTTEVYEITENPGAGQTPASAGTWQEKRAALPQNQRRDARKAAVAGAGAAVVNSAKSKLAVHKEKRVEIKVNRASKAYNREKVRITGENQTKWQNGEIPNMKVATHEQVEARLAERAAIAQQRKDTRLAPIRAIAAGARATGRGAAAVSRPIAKVADVAIIGPSKEFASMSRALNEDTKHINPVYKGVEALKERTAQAQVLKSTTRDVRVERVTAQKQEKREAKTELKGTRQDIKAIKGKVERKVYAREMYGTDTKGKALPGRAPAPAPQRATARIPNPPAPPAAVIPSKPAPTRQAPPVVTPPATRQAPPVARQTPPSKPAPTRQAPPVVTPPAKRQPPRATPPASRPVAAPPRATPPTAAPPSNRQVPPPPPSGTLPPRR